MESNLLSDYDENVHSEHDIKHDIKHDKKDETNNKIMLTEDQTLIYNQLIDYIKSTPDQLKDKYLKEILLVGYAGTGKTTMVTKLMHDLIDKKICKRIVIAAPTHKAVNIAKSKLFANLNDNQELEKNIDIMTIHRLLNYQSYIDPNTGEKYFAKSSVDPNWTIYDLIVVDECSMLSNQIINDITNQINNPVNSKVKIIYVGDPAQLPPVNQNDSKVFSKQINTLTLEKIIRTKNKEIMELSNDHRKWIFSKKNEDIPNVFKYNTKRINLYSIKAKDTLKWLNRFIEIIGSNKIKSGKEESNFDNNIILTWTNKKCNMYNQYVREKIFNKKDLAHFEIGEILIFNDFHRIEKINLLNNSDDEDEKDNKDNKDDKDDKKENKKKKVIEKEFVSFYTSEQIKVISIENIKYKFNKIKFKHNNVITQELNDKFKKRLGSINELIDIEISAFKLNIKKMSDLKISEANSETYTIYSVHPDSEKDFNKIIEEYENQILKLRKSCDKEINKMKKTDNMIKCNLHAEVGKKINKLYRDWQNNVIDKFAQLNYGYSITVHKSQGSTFKNVFIDISDILENNNIEETSRCLYTAITRSSKTLDLLI